jgi:hypothetical protein
MPAIIGAVQQFVGEETERRGVAHKQAYSERMEAERLAAEARLLSGADYKWTALGKSKTFHFRLNGRTYRLEPQPDNRLSLLRSNRWMPGMVSSSADINGVPTRRRRKRGRLQPGT